MNDKQIGALIHLLTGLSKEYKGLGIRRWSVYGGRNIAVAHRRVRLRDTGELLLQSAQVDLSNRQLVPREDGVLFRTGDPALDPPAMLERKAEKALREGEEADGEARDEAYRWAAAYGSAAAWENSAKGAALAAEAYRRLGDTANAARYAAFAP